MIYCVMQSRVSLLEEDGDFITFQYSLFKKKFIENFFAGIRTKFIMRNFPPAYVLDCKGVKNE